MASDEEAILIEEPEKVEKQKESSNNHLYVLAASIVTAIMCTLVMIVCHMRLFEPGTILEEISLGGYTFFFLLFLFLTGSVSVFCLAVIDTIDGTTLAVITVLTIAGLAFVMLDQIHRNNKKGFFGMAFFFVATAVVSLVGGFLSVRSKGNSKSYWWAKIMAGISAISLIGLAIAFYQISSKMID